MGLFDALVGQAVQAVSGQLLQGGNMGNLAQVAISLVQNHEGGLGGLVQSLSKGGLEDAVQSWVGTGENRPVDASQISSALGAGQLGELASKFGIDEQQISAGLAMVLPMVINHLTPQGEVNSQSGDLLQQGASAIIGSLFKS